MQTRDRLHRLIDELPESQLPVVERFLTGRGAGPNPILQALADAPEDDEPLTPEDEAAIEEAYRDLAAGNVVPNDELWRRLGHAPEG